MTREERRSELGIIISSLESIMDELCTEQSKLEELRCGEVAKKVNRACDKLQVALWAASKKEASL